MNDTGPRLTRFDVIRNFPESLSLGPAQPRPSRFEAWLAALAPVILVGTIAVAALGQGETDWPSWGILGLAGALLIASLVREIRERDLRGIWRWVPLLLVPLLYDRPLSLAGILGLRHLIMALRTVTRHPVGRRATDYLWSHPVEFLAVGFAATIGIGAVLLLFPASCTQPAGLSWVDALFTSTSATCVTGLTVVDTATVFTTFGKGVIVALIQVGGIGVMALSTLAAVVAGKKLGATQSGAVAASMETTTNVDAVGIVRAIVLGTLAVEGVGAAILTVSFLPDRPFAEAVGWGVFHSVSAFCNAGFALWTDNLCPAATFLPVSLAVSFLILLGGLGFLVLPEVGGWIVSRRRRRHPLALHTRLVLATTAILVVAGTLLFALLEWNGALGHLDWPWKLVNAYFQSVTTRTAGFNTVPLGALTNAAILVVVLLMFIGASPGSTGGGIKTTTAAVITLAVRGFVRGQDRVEVFGRTVPAAIVIRAIVLVFLAALVVTTGFLMLLMTQSVRFESLLFEAVSAFATVGLSIGATAEVDSAGKLVLVALMYVGRVGPLTLILLLGSAARAPIRYPEEPVALT